MVAFAGLGCHAQSIPQPGGKLSPDLARRVEVMIRSRSEIPPEYVVSISDRRKSDIPGFDEITVSFSTAGNKSRPLTFLLSTDGKTLGQFNRFDISQDPKEKVSASGRPARGGPENAPVLIVGFDDLECPFCAKMNAALFPAILERYKDQVRIVYRDFPEEQHPWAMHAAVDANCLAASTPAGYWNYVDTVHQHAAEIGGDEHSIAKAAVQLDTFAQDEGVKQKVNTGELAACLKKQDDTKLKAALQEAEAQPLAIGATPTLFINGEKLEGAIPLEDVYRVIDEALVAAGRTPPPPAPAAPPAAAPPAPKPGN